MNVRFLHNLFIVTFLVSALFILGCNTQQDEVDVGGISISFRDGAPPKSVLEGREFNIIVDLENSGDYGTDVQLCFSDTGNVCVDGKDCSHSVFLKEAELVKNGNKETLKITKEELPYSKCTYYDVLPSTNPTISVDALFHYENEAEGIICLKGENVKEELGVGCQENRVIKGKKLLKQMRAPIVVEKIEENLIIVEEGLFDLDLNIYLRLKEPKYGYVASNGEMGLRVYLQREGSIFECFGEGIGDLGFITWRQDETKKVINCRAPSINIGLGDAFEDKIIVEMDYDFETRASRTIEIKKRKGKGDIFEEL